MACRHAGDIHSVVQGGRLATEQAQGEKATGEMALPSVEGPARVHIKFLACQCNARTEGVKGSSR